MSKELISHFQRVKNNASRELNDLEINVIHGYHSLGEINFDAIDKQVADLKETFEEIKRSKS